MKRTLAIIITVFLWVAAAAQIPDETEVYFVTVYPGSEIYELEGHSAIAVITPDGRALCYNYGVFDFNAPNFVWRFVKGETDYMATAGPAVFFFESYAAEGRRVVAQKLNLGADGTRRLLEILQHDIDPRYRTYRYNYVLDNCATRPLRAIERAVGDTIILAPAPFEAQSLKPLTFRNIMRHYHRNYPWYQFGIDLALGSGIDRPISRREASFAPAELETMLRHATTAGRPLVSEEVAIVNLPADAAVAGPTPWYLTPDAAGWLIFVLALAYSVRDIRRRSGTRWFDTALFALFTLAGCLITFLVFVSSHEATSPNILLAWLNPFCIIPVIFIWIKRGQKVLIRYYFINFAVLTAMCALWPFLGQSGNTAFVPLIAADMLRSGVYIYINRKK